MAHGQGLLAIPSLCHRPTKRLAVDFDDDGRRDLVSSTTDALASTANFLKKRAGWQTGYAMGL
jgi:membrane-bound lytic murein transglycosylase B